MSTSNNVISAELHALICRAEQGDESALPELRQQLDADPGLSSRFGDLARHSEDTWLKLFADSNLFLVETVRRKLKEWRSDLEGANPSPIEKMAVEKAAACWLQSHYADAMYAQNAGAGVSAGVRRELELHQASANKRLLASLKQLAQIRKLIAPPSPKPRKLKSSDALLAGRPSKAANSNVSDDPLLAGRAAVSTKVNANDDPLLAFTSSAKIKMTNNPQLASQSGELKETAFDPDLPRISKQREVDSLVNGVGVMN